MTWNWNNIWLIFQREVRDQVRDRRTLFMIVVLPLLLYPGLAIGVLQASLLFSEQPRTVVVLGAANLPENLPLLNGNRFGVQWFTVPDEVDKLHVVSDLSSAQGNNAALIAQARQLAPLIQELKTTQEEASKKRGQPGDESLTRIAELKEQIAERFAATKAQVLLIVPDGLKEKIERTNRTLKGRSGQSLSASEEDKTRPLVIENSADEKSLFAYQRVKSILSNWEQRLLQQRLSQARLPATLSTPVNPLTIDVAVARQLSANLWSKLFPTLLIIMAVTGAFYPAVDVAAGEKERGTMETLLICPAQRSEIVLGKFFTVLTFSVSTVVLNLVSMGITGKYLVPVARSEALAKIGGALSFPSAWELFWLVILLLPLAAFYSAVSLALATFARSTKEGQYYLTPLLLVTLGLTLFCLSPVVEIEPFYSILPVVGPALLLKEVLANPGSAAPLYYGVPVLLTSAAYSAAGLWWAIAMFKREDVLFREAERFNVRLWLRHLLRDKEPVPSISEAGLCFVVILFLQFAAVRFLRGGLMTADGAFEASSVMRLLLIQQLVLVGSPALFMGILLTTSVRRTFRLRLPSLEHFATALGLALVVYPLTVALGAWLQDWFFPPLPKHVVELMQAVSSPTAPIGFVLLAMAVAPGICEETAYRGFILSGIMKSAGPRVAIVLSAIAFGVTHIVPQQVFNATLLGLLLGLLAVRSGSLLPGVVFHMLYNSFELLRVRFPVAQTVAHSAGVWIRTDETGHLVQFRWPLLLLAGFIAALLIARLLRGNRHVVSQADSSSSGAESNRISEIAPVAEPPLPTI